MPPSLAEKCSGVPCQNSTRVITDFDVGAERVSVKRLRPDFVMVKAVLAYFPGPARLLVTVDNDLTVRPVILTECIQSGAVRAQLVLGCASR